MKIPNTLRVRGKRMVCRIFDSGPDKGLDRYTVAFRGYRSNGRMTYPYLAANEHPFHPQGFGQHGENPTFLTGRQIGARIKFEDCPVDVKKFILDNI